MSFGLATEGTTRRGKCNLQNLIKNTDTVSFFLRNIYTPSAGARDAKTATTTKNRSSVDLEHKQNKMSFDR